MQDKRKVNGNCRTETFIMIMDLQLFVQFHVYT